MLAEFLGWTLVFIVALFGVMLYDWHKAEYLHERFACSQAMGCLFFLSIPVTLGLIFVLR